MKKPNVLFEESEEKFSAPNQVHFEWNKIVKNQRYDCGV